MKAKRKQSKRGLGVLNTPWEAQGTVVLDADSRPVAIATTPDIARLIAAAPRMEAHLSMELDWRRTAHRGADIENSLYHWWQETAELLRDAGGQNVPDPAEYKAPETPMEWAYEALRVLYQGGDWLYRALRLGWPQGDTQAVLPDATRRAVWEQWRAMATAKDKIEELLKAEAAGR